MKTNYIESFIAARRSGVPIIIIRTPDIAATISEIKTASKAPLLQWDICRGVLGVNEEGASGALKINDGSEAAIATGNPVEALQRALEFMPDNSVLCMMNFHLFLEGMDDSRKPVIQAVWNCRDAFESSGRTLVILCPSMAVPPELSNDVITLDVALPNEADLAVVIKDIFSAAKLETPTDEHVTKGVDAICGLSQFSAKQVAAMALSKRGLNFETMWDHKKAIIEQAGGLTVHRGAESFDELGGLENIKQYLRLIIGGKRPPKLVVLIDEAEKQMAGTGDTSGVSQDAFGQILSNMQDNNWSGIILPGFPGTGKTECAKAMGAEAGGLFLSLDLGGMKGSLVGQSEKMVRNAMATLKAMGGEDVFFVATCNSMANLKPELKRRFGYGTFFFDLPTTEEQKPIWAIYRRRFNIAEQELPSCSSWTGAEIKQVCKLADQLGISLIKAGEYITPVVKSMGEDVKALRASANGKYLSAAYAGEYTMKEATPMTLPKRKVIASN